MLLKFPTVPGEGQMGHDDSAEEDAKPSNNAGSNLDISDCNFDSSFKIANQNLERVKLDLNHVRMAAWHHSVKSDHLRITHSPITPHSQKRDAYGGVRRPSIPCGAAKR